MGYLRFILALLVCANHLWMIGVVGRYAVFSFYIISGYLMTTILLGKYGLTYSGIRKYIINRFLRIYPLYWVVLLFSIISISFLGDFHPPSQFSGGFDFPKNTIIFLKNITLIGLDFNVNQRLVPPGWTLFIEVFFYLAIPIFLKLGKKAIFIWLIISIGYHIFHVFLGNHTQDWNIRYGTIYAGSLGFSLGCATRLFLYKKSINLFLLKISYIGLFFCFALPVYFMFRGFNPSQWLFMSNTLYYIAMVFSCLVINDLIDKKPSKLSQFIGNLSYPLYLTHIIIGYVIACIFDLKYNSISLFLIGTIASIIVSIILHQFLETSINKIRQKIAKS